MTPAYDCVGANHAPGCGHFPGDGVRSTVRPPSLDELRPPPRLIHDHPVALPGLGIALNVGVSRFGRGRCPDCDQRRVLFALSAFAADQPVGYGRRLCAACAGLRPR